MISISKKGALAQISSIKGLNILNNSYSWFAIFDLFSLGAVDDVPGWRAISVTAITYSCRTIAW